MQDAAQCLLDEFRLAFLDDQHGALAGAELHDFIGNQRIRHIQNVERHFARSERIGISQELQRAQHAVIETSLQDDADIGVCAARLVQTRGWR